MDAESEAAVRARLRSDGQYPVSIVPSGATRGWGPAVLGRGFGSSRVKPSAINSFTRQLATLIGAGIPLDLALTSIVEQMDNPPLKRIVAQIKEALSQGEPLSRALTAHPQHFTAMYVNMVLAGEAFGSLDVVLSRLADFGDRYETMRAKLRAAMIYPTFMALVGASVLFVLITFVVPDILQVYAKMEKALPLPTQIMIGLSNLFRNYWWVLLFGAAAVVLLLKVIAEKPSGKHLRDRALLKSPLLGKVNNQSVLFRFSSTLESLLKSGVAIVDAMEISKRVVDNSCISEVIDEAIEEIRVGRSMVGPLVRSEWFPSTFVQLVAVGESSGRLEEMLEKLSIAAEQELESSTLGLMSLIEPVLIVLMGILVGFIVLSILLPIFEMNQAIR